MLVDHPVNSISKRQGFQTYGILIKFVDDLVRDACLDIRWNAYGQLPPLAAASPVYGAVSLNTVTYATIGGLTDGWHRNDEARDSMCFGFFGENDMGLEGLETASHGAMARQAAMTYISNCMSSLYLLLFHKYRVSILDFPIRPAAFGGIHSSYR